MTGQTSSKYRLVDRYLVRGGCEPLAERIAAIIPSDAEYVVLDLDRTVHLGITIGERLGWEIMGGAAEAPVDDDDEQLTPLMAASRPLHTSRLIAKGLRHWAVPGLMYASTVRLGDRWETWDRLLSVSVIGSGYVERVQELLRSILMANAADLTSEELATYARRAWRRFEDRLVITREVVGAIRAHCPKLRKVLLSSASTTPTVAHAARELDVDGFVASAVDMREDGEATVYTAPVGLPLWFRPGRPRFLSRPGAVLHNAAARKVSLLRMEYPEVFASGGVTVGISDNNYGEDSCWPDHFRHVVALNSLHPFSPFVARQSPCETIQTVDARPAMSDDDDRSDHRWLGHLEEHDHDGASLRGIFEDAEIGKLDTLCEQLRTAREAAAAAVDASLRPKITAVVGRLSDAIEEYNRASADRKTALAREVNRLSRRVRRMRSGLAPLERHAARIRHEIESFHEHAARIVVARSR